MKSEIYKKRIYNSTKDLSSYWKTNNKSVFCTETIANQNLDILGLKKKGVKALSATLKRAAQLRSSGRV